jgi:hypothetical protein
MGKLNECVVEKDCVFSYNFSTGQQRFLLLAPKREQVYSTSFDACSLLDTN